MRNSFLALSVVALWWVAVAAETTTPMPTFPPPKFNGYIMLAQYNCDTFECTEWELDVTRLATECFTWDCQYEQQIQLTLDPEAAAAKRDFSVFTAAHHPTRRFYTVGLDKNRGDGAATLWTAKVAGDMTNSTLVKRVSFKFPSSRYLFASLEVDPITGHPMAIYEDGTLSIIDPETGATTTVGNFLQNFTRMANQATVVDAATSTLYAFTRNVFGSEPQFVTYDLKTQTINATVPFLWLPYQTEELTPFQLSWISPIQQLIAFTTNHNFDHLIYVDPKTGNTSWAIYNLMEYHHLGFQRDAAARSVDTLKTNTFDAATGILYFQASKYSSDGFATTSLASTPPFTPGMQPAALPWLNVNLSPVNFGYQGYHYFHCEGPCPT